MLRPRKVVPVFSVHLHVAEVEVVLLGGARHDATRNEKEHDKTKATTQLIANGRSIRSPSRPGNAPLRKHEEANDDQDARPPLRIPAGQVWHREASAVHQEKHHANRDEQQRSHKRGASKASTVGAPLVLLCASLGSPCIAIGACLSLPCLVLRTLPARIVTRIVRRRNV